MPSSSYSYISVPPQRHYYYNYTARIRVNTPDLNFSSTNFASPSPSTSRPYYPGYSPRDSYYFSYHNNYCYGAGSSYPAHSRNWEPSRAASPRLYSHRQYVSIQRSRSGSGAAGQHHYHSPSHHHHHHDYVRVLREVWERKVEHEQELEKINKGLVCEVNNLKTNLSTAQAEIHRLCSVVIPQLECQISNLTADNQVLRRQLETTTGSCGRHHAEIEALRIRINHQEKEIKDLRCDKANLVRRVEELLRQINHNRGCGGGCNRRVEELLRDVNHWKDKFLDMQDRRNALSDTLAVQERKIRAYEDILRRNGFICP